MGSDDLTAGAAWVLGWVLGTAYTLAVVRIVWRLARGKRDESSDVD